MEKKTSSRACYAEMFYKNGCAKPPGECTQSHKDEDLIKGTTSQLKLVLQSKYCVEENRRQSISTADGKQIELESLGPFPSIVHRRNNPSYDPPIKIKSAEPFVRIVDRRRNPNYEPPTPIVQRNSDLNEGVKFLVKEKYSEGKDILQCSDEHEEYGRIEEASRVDTPQINLIESELCELHDPGGMDSNDDRVEVDVVNNDNNHSIINNTEVLDIVSEERGEVIRSKFEAITGEKQQGLCGFRNGVLNSILEPERRAEQGTIRFVAEKIMFDSDLLRCSYISKQLVNPLRQELGGSIQAYESSVTLRGETKTIFEIKECVTVNISFQDESNDTVEGVVKLMILDVPGNMITIGLPHILQHYLNLFVSMLHPGTKNSQIIDDDSNVMKNDNDNEYDTLAENFSNMNSKYEPSAGTKDIQMIDDDPNVMRTNNKNDECATLENNFRNINSKNESNMLAVDGYKVELKSIEPFASILDRQVKPNYDPPTQIKQRDSNLNTGGELSESEIYSNNKDHQGSND
jgi:hypothetical protein